MLGHSGLDALWLRHTVVSNGYRYEDATARLQLARKTFLAGPWDSMLIIDDDLIVPQDTYARLQNLASPVAYALTVRRNHPRFWSAVLEHDSYSTLDQYTRSARELWGQVVNVVGCGHNPTLIWRSVIERFPFEQRGKHGTDRYFAEDCYRNDIRMACDTSIIVGHVEGDTVYYPSIDPFPVREEKLDLLIPHS